MTSWCQDRRLWVSCRMPFPVALPTIWLLTGYSFILLHAQMSCPFELCSHECTFGVCMWTMCLGCPVCSLSPSGLCNSRRNAPLGFCDPLFPGLQIQASLQNSPYMERQLSVRSRSPGNGNRARSKETMLEERWCLISHENRCCVPYEGLSQMPSNLIVIQL